MGLQPLGILVIILNFVQQLQVISLIPVDLPMQVKLAADFRHFQVFSLQQPFQFLFCWLQQAKNLLVFVHQELIHFYHHLLVVLEVLNHALIPCPS